MNFGIGIDCVEINRFDQQKSSFFNKMFSEKERAYCYSKEKPIQHFAAKFAGKEAVVKAFYSFGIKIGIINVEILNKESGIPYVIIKKKIPHSYNVKISLSHSETIAIAEVLVFEEA